MYNRLKNKHGEQGENNLVILVTVRQKTMGLEQNGTYDDSLSRCGRSVE